MNFLRWALFGAYLALTIGLSSMTRPPVAEAVSDKVLHMLEFGTMAVLLVQALGQGLFKRHTARHLWITAAFGVLYGAADEIHQYFTPGRHSDVRDWAADSVATIGTVATIALLGWLLGRRARSASPTSLLPPDPPRVELLTRHDCHLCEEARAVLESVLGTAGRGFEEVDVDSVPSLADQYGEEVPVVLIDGIKRFKGAVGEPRLRRLLAERGRLRRRESRSGADAGGRQEHPAIDPRSLAGRRPSTET